MITGVYTGSDMSMKITFHETMMGLLGQNLSGDSNLVWITKTHKPLDGPSSLSFNASKMFVIARNPIDVMPSFANLINTGSHSLVPNEQYHVDMPQYWQKWIETCVTEIKENHDIVVNRMARQIPTYFMRYEDLKMNPRPALEELFCFLLDVASIENTNVQRRIHEVTQADFSKK